MLTDPNNNFLSMNILIEVFQWWAYSIRFSSWVIFEQFFKVSLSFGFDIFTHFQKIEFIYNKNVCQ